MERVSRGRRGLEARIENSWDEVGTGEVLSRDSSRVVRSVVYGNRWSHNEIVQLTSSRCRNFERR